MQRKNAYAKPIEVTCCSSSLFSPCLFVSVSLSVFTFLFGLVLLQTQMVNDRVADMDIQMSTEVLIIALHYSERDLAM